jgi:hypothetical protein
LELKNQGKKKKERKKEKKPLCFYSLKMIQIPSSGLFEVRCSENGKQISIHYAEEACENSDLIEAK